MAKTGKINKSAVTGRIVSDRYAKTHPKTTYQQTVKIGQVKKQGK